MPKRVRSNSKLKRQKDKIRKRESRQQEILDVPPPNKVESIDPCGSVDRAFTAPPGNLPGSGLMGFPPKEEKPLARMQASPRVKMHPPASRFPSPRGSRLFVKNVTKAPSPDSPAWVCTPARVPGHDEGSEPSPAGQAQLDTSMLRGSSSISKDEEIKTVFKTASDCKNSTDSVTVNLVCSERKYNTCVNLNTNQNKPCNTFENGIDNMEKKSNLQNKNCENVGECNVLNNTTFPCIQGSFHQAHPMFGDNAGTQCVANCLAGLAFEHVKKSIHWTTHDMNKILATGNELYTFLQRSSLIQSRYLLVDELPQYFECFDRSFEFTTNSTLASMICFSNEEPCYADFDAYPLYEALQMALTETEGCFVCFAGNTFLIGKTNDVYFTFDSHSRTARGLFSPNGKSTRLLFKSVDDLFMHIQTLARSMGFSDVVECNLTGVNCRSVSMEIVNKVPKTDENLTENNQQLNEENRADEVLYLHSEKETYRFHCLSESTRQQLCNVLDIQYSDVETTKNCEMSEKELGKPCVCEEIIADGNCFFRAISYSLSHSQDYHHTLRLAICNHILRNKNVFKTFMRSTETSIESHVLSMMRTGKWATELEILACAHLLGLDIFTFSGCRWIRFSGKNVRQSFIPKKVALYLNHKDENHYNVVLDVGDSNASVGNGLKIESVNVKTDNHSTQRFLDKKEKSLQYKREAFNRKYKENAEFRNQKLKKAYLRYRMDDEFRMTLKEKNQKRYQSDASYKTHAKLRSRAKYRENAYRDRVLTRAAVRYKTDSIHRDNVKQKVVKKYRTNRVHRETCRKQSLQKYKTDTSYRENVKTRSKMKYRNNDEHRQRMKTRSVTKNEMNEKHRENVKKRSIEKYHLDKAHKKKVKDTSILKYNSDENYRRTLLQTRAMRYKTDEAFRLKAKEKSKQNYFFNHRVKEMKKENSKQSRLSKKIKLEHEEEVVSLFKRSTARGPDFACCCCHRLLFENQVQRCDKNVYAKSEKAANVAEVCISDAFLHNCTDQCSEKCSKSSLWICYTCHRKVLSGDMPPEATANKMHLDPVPEELSCLNSLEQHLISLHIPFMKVMALPKGGQKNIHGPVVCVPSDVKKTSMLPLKPNENFLLRVKLKRKLNYKGYYEYQFINPANLTSALEYLKQNNQWYEGVAINREMDSFDGDEDLTQEQTEPCDEDSEPQQVAIDSCLQPVDIAQEVLDHFFDDVFNIAPAEGNNPVRMLQESGNEAKSFPCQFPSGRFSYDEQREKRITLARYFNNRLMNADNRFAKDTNYIFFSQYMSELNQVIEKTQISIRKTVAKIDKRNDVSPDMIRNPETLSKLLRNDEAIRFMQPIRGTPAYWSAIQKDLFAMLRQLGIPTWFCSFSSAEYRWNDAISSLLKQQNDHREPEMLDWAEKNEILKSNPVTVARMFEHRFRMFQRDVINSPLEPIGKIIDFFQRVEFQQRGSPHMHCLFWVENAPRIDVHGKQAVADFIDKYVTCSIPQESEDSELRNIVLDVQQHSKKHSKSCKKNGAECRFNFPRPPSQRTFITEVNEDENVEETEFSHETDTIDSKSELTKSQAKDILLSVWNKIQSDSDEFKTTEEVFNELSLTQEVYENALNILSKKLTVVLRRQPNEVWTNQYNPCLLKCWNANMDIQFVLDPFSCIVYIVSYISKSEREMGMLLRQTKIEAQEGNLDAKHTLKKIGSAYLTHREVTAQEAVYRVCNLRMKEASRKVIFIPVGENPTRMTKPLSQMKKTRHCAENSEGGDEDDDIWMTNIVERYENRPNSNDFNNMCLAEFCSDFRILAKSQVPKGRNENVFELQNSKGFVQKRTRTKEAVVRYPRFNAEKSSEKYYQSQLQLFLPYRNQTQLKPEGFETYESFYDNGFVKLHNKRSVQSVKQIVESNHTRYAENENSIDRAQEMYEHLGEPEDAWANLCPETEKNRDECIMERNSELNTDDVADTIPDIEHESTKADIIYHVQQSNVSNEEMLRIMQSLNETQQRVFYYVRDWCLRKIVNDNPKPKAFHIFITGGAGTGKSQLIKAINFEASRLFARTMSSLDALSVLLTAFTGTASFNIGGCTIHSVFSLSKYLPIPYEPLKEQTLSEIRVKLADLQILVIDEVSMVYKRLLYYIHERLVQIKKCKEPFGGVSIIAVGDFFQLPPVKQRKDERLYKDNALYPTDYWQDFHQVELTEIMRQRDDVPFATALNLLRTRTLEEPLANETLDLVHECIREGPEDVLHVYSTNDEVNAYNLRMLYHKCEDFKEIIAKDYKKDRTTGKLCLTDKTVQSKNDSLSSSLLFAVNARVMLTRNCDVKDGLVNGVMGYISHFVYGDVQKTNVTAVAVVFDSKDVGKTSGKQTKNGNLVLIERVQEEIVIRKSITCVRHQFPLKLSWACTAHKVQGMTVDKVVVNLDKTFAPGQAYVALTRVTSKNGLYIETDNREKLTRKLYADSDVKLAMDDMQKLVFEDQQSTSFRERKVIFHNIQSLNRNFSHMKNDRRFLDADVICLNETWLWPDQNACHLTIDGFQLHHLLRREAYDSDDERTKLLHESKGGGVAMYIKENEDEKKIVHCSVQNIESIAVKFSKENFIIVTVFRPPTLKISVFLQALQSLIDEITLQCNTCIFIGDFNEDAKSNGPIQTFMTNHGFSQIVQYFTTEGGTTLDHVYISNSVNAYTKKLSTFYSYHDAVCIFLSL